MLESLLLSLCLTAVPAADAARAAAEALCQADAKCEGMDCYLRARCQDVSDAPFQAPKGAPTLVLHAERPSDGEGNIVDDRYYRWDGEELVPLFTVHSDSGGDGPHTSEDATLVVCRARSNGVPELDLRTSRTEVSAPEGPDEDWKTRTQDDLEHLVWTGKEFQRRLATEPCAEPPKPPSWLASASASSVLVEKSLPKDYYQAQNAADSLPETAWAEGAKGPGTGEWLLLALSKPLALSKVKLLAGCGVNAKLWKTNERLKTVALVFSDGESQKASLSDTAYGEFATIAVQREKPTSSLKIVVGEVYEARFEDACISEVVLVAR